MSNEDQIFWAEVVKAICLKFGTEVRTAYKVAAEFAAGLARECPPRRENVSGGHPCG